jgi:hypothetical protein
MAAKSNDDFAHEAAESEKALLGALMLDSTAAWPKVNGLVGQQHIARADHRLIFGAIASIIGKGGIADAVIVIDSLAQRGDLEAAGGQEYIKQLQEGALSAANVAAYAQTVRDHADINKVVDITSEVGARARLGSAVEALEHATRAFSGIDIGRPAKPLDLSPVAVWAERPEPRPREWIVEGLIPAAKVTSLFGNGGLGKTLLALQIGLHVSLARRVFGLTTLGGGVLGIFCEDEEDELNRRLRAACAAECLELDAVDRFVAISRDGVDSVLCTYEHDHIRLTSFYAQLDVTIAQCQPWLVILDTAADLFAGDFVSTPHVRQFIKVALGGLCVRHGCAILLLAHPSAAAMSSGDGGGFSTAWSNSVRSRLYLSRPKVGEDEDPSVAKDRRVLEVKKSNYAPDGVQIPLLYERGSFVLDPDPVATSSGVHRQRTTRLALAAVEYVRAQDPLTVSFRTIFDALQSRGEIPAGEYQERRKPLSRAMRQLVTDGLLTETRYPRGYKVGISA